MLYTLGALIPKLGRDVYVAPNASIVGDVVLGDEVSVWFGCVLRGDVGAIRVGARSNIQDLTMVHMTGGLSHTDIGEEVTVGHNVLLHGCVVGDRCLIGMGAILMDNVDVGADCLIAAGTLLSPRTRVPARSLVRGSPGKVIRTLTDQELQMTHEGAAKYVENARRYRAAGI